MAHSTERTPLLRENFDSTIKLYNKRDRNYYTCLFACLGALIFVAFVATIWYIFELKSILSDVNRQNERDLNILLRLEWPRADVEAPFLPYQSLITLINEAVDEGKQQLKVRQLKDENVVPLDSDSPSFKHQKSIVYSTTGSNLSNYGYIETIATKYLRERGVRNVINYDSATDLKWADETDCHHFNESTLCEATPYRSISGSCNNLKNPLKWGVAMTPFRRGLAPEYDDGVSVPRGDFKTSLPSARVISSKINRPVYREDENFTVMLAVWGQFLDHDLTATALSRGVNGTPITCCNSKIQHPECFPVLLNSDDPYYNEFNLTCMEFVRSAPALRCSFGPREQLNQASSYIDGSMIYGNVETLSERLRNFNNGELEMSYTSEGRALLPVTTDPIDGCNQQEEIKKGRYCFLTGDARANENTHLTSIHLILARQHNNISNQLRAFNPFWDDETLYQESRRIVTAQLQHITYNEFLPSILDDQLMEKLELYSYKTGYWTKYNDSIDASISNNFASATFRFAHTLIPRMMKLLANDTDSPEYVEMHKMLFNPFSLYDGELDSIIRGALNTSIEKSDNFFPEELTQHLFESANTKNSSTKSFGLDLVSLNIQRGRDHGLPAYVKWREYCNLSSVHTFEDLNGIFDEESLKSVSSLYKSVDEIDLYTGGLSEIPIPGGLLGPTLTCLIADQFYRLKHGDRFWYETNEKPQAFTPEQLDEIRKTTLAGIICQNADDLKMVTPAVMRSTKENNEHIPCSQVPQIDLSVWRVNPENRFELNVIRLRIKYPDRAFTWNNQSDASISPQLLRNGYLTSALAWRSTTDRHNVVDLSGTFVFVNKNGEELKGLFELTAETSANIDVNNTRIKYPVYVTAKNDADHNDVSTNLSKIILHTIPLSSGKLAWTGSVTVDLIPLSWNNATDSSKLNKTKENVEPQRSDDFTARSGASSNSEGLRRQITAQSETSHRVAFGENEKKDELQRSENSTVKRAEPSSSGSPHLLKTAQPETGSLGASGEKEKNIKTHLSENYTDKTNESSTLEGHHPQMTTGQSAEVSNHSAVDGEDEFTVPTKRADHSSNLEKDYDFLRKHANNSAEVEELDSAKINTTLPEVANSNFSHEENILYHILEMQTSKPLLSKKEITLEEDELQYLQQLSPNSSSIYLHNTPKRHPVEEQITPVRILAESVEIGDQQHVIFKPPVQIPISSLQNETVVWNFNLTHPLSGSFQLPHQQNGTFKIKYVNLTNDNNGLAHLHPACIYYSMVTLDPSKPTTNQLPPTADLFDMDLPSAPTDGCTIIAPLQLHGNMSSPDTFAWNGNATIYVRKPRTDLAKEDELSLGLHPKHQVLGMEKVIGTVSLSNGSFLWNGTLPALFNVAAGGSNFGWSSSNRTIAYPITWSGVHDDNDSTNFTGNFFVLQKRVNSAGVLVIDKVDGKFSISLPASGGICNFIKPFSINQSIVYLTEALFYVDDVDVSQFDAINDWDSSKTSSIVLTGKFVQNGSKFVWLGNTTFILPAAGETAMSNPTITMTTYRPHGKYLAKIYDATLFAVLDDTLSVLKWWSGVLPSSVVIPANTSQIDSFKRMFNRAVSWSYEDLGQGTAHGTFRTYGDHSKIHLFGDFQFQLSSLFVEIRTSVLKPGTEYYSPLTLQGERNADSDLIIELNSLRNSTAGVFAPIMLLGNYTKNGQFEWNLSCIVHVEDGI